MINDRKIIFYEKYFLEFYVEQTIGVQQKIEFVFKIIKTVEKIPRKYFEHMEGTKGLFEIRVEFESNIFRIFCCFDEGNIVVLFNGFQKKTQKTPNQEIELATKLRKEYFSKKTEMQKAEMLIRKKSKTKSK